MALIRVNNKEENLLGALSFERELMYNEAGKPVGFQIAGTLAIHDYEEEIYHIESERYELKGVNVYKESFASNEFMILYHFTAEEMSVKPDHVNDDIKWLIEEDTINSEIDNREWYHAYATEEAYKEVEKLVEKYQNKTE